MATITDVARHAGVGPSTVSRALSQHGYVAPATRERVLESAQALGYVSNRIARSLRTRRSGMLGLLVSDVENPFYSVIAKHVETTAKALNYHVVLCNDNDDPADEREYLTILEGLGVDGAILTPTARNRNHIERLIAKGIPVVQIDRQVTGLQADAVLADNEAGVRAAVDHLAAAGHSRIGMLAGPSSVTTGRRRFRGFMEAMKDHGLPVSPEMVRHRSFRRDHAIQEARELLEGRSRPTAVIAANNILAEACFMAIEQLGLRIPRDVSLIAFDDLPWMAMTSPKLTSIRQPIVEMTRAATNRLLDRIRDPSLPKSTVIFRPELIVRESVKSPASVRTADRRLRSGVTAGRVRS